ncbi:MAG: hypothetical protein II784_04475 [Oscillospiraceae bacterium]|nr:hypothetical protein [Oscillospiraceae bacterium]
MFHTDYTMPPVEEEDPVIPPITADGVSALGIDRFLTALATGEKAVPPEYGIALIGAIASAMTEYAAMSSSILSDEEKADLRFDAEVTTADFMWQAQRFARIACGVIDNSDSVESVLKEVSASAASAAEFAIKVKDKATGSGVSACETAAEVLKSLCDPG